MDEDYCLTGNAVAERANGIIKQEDIGRRRSLPSKPWRTWSRED